MSIRAVNILQNLQRAFPTFFSVVAVLAPKYPSERTFFENENTNGDGNLSDNVDQKNVFDYLLIPSEKPENILLDAKLESWKELTIKNWPTVLICVNKKGDENSKENGLGKIIFALESQRAVTNMIAKSLSAVLTVIQYEEEKKENESVVNTDGTENKINLAGVGMWGKNFDALWTSTPLLPSLGTGEGKVKINTFNRPMRLSVNNKNGMLYISDSGIILYRVRSFHFASTINEILFIIMEIILLHSYLVLHHFMRYNYFY